MKESGPASTRKSPIRSVAMVPPSRSSGFEEYELDAEGFFFGKLDDAVRGRQSRDAAADDGDALHEIIGSRMEDG